MKHTLRQEVRERCKALTPALRSQKSKIIWEKLKERPEFKSAQKILVYLSKEGEVETHEEIQKLFEKKDVFAPKIQERVMSIHPIRSWDNLEPGTFKILEPKNCKSIASKELDLVLVPGIAFDKNGHRIGHGKGHYDRLLKHTSATKIGLAFHEQILDNEVPFEDHDIPMNLIITDKEILTP